MIDYNIEETMTFRVLEPSEWKLVEAEFASREVALPDPKTSFIVGAFHEGAYGDGLAGFVVCQPVMHLEPLVLYNPHALRGLVHEAERWMAQKFTGCFYAFAEGRVAGLAEAMGLEKMSYGVFRKEIN